MNWQPTDYDVLWTENLLDKLVDDGEWMVPASTSIIKINKNNMTYTLEGDIEHECNKKIMFIMSILGWEKK